MSKLLKIVIAAAVILAAGGGRAEAQKIGLKTNLLYWGTGTVNVAAEIAVAPKITLDIAGTSNIPGLIYFGDRALNRKLWHWTARPEVRFWHTEAFNRGFVGFHAMTGAFAAGGIKLPFGILPEFGSHRYEGWMVGAGAGYGWQWWVSPRWNVEATFGLGYLYLEYNRFETPPSGVIDRKNQGYHYFGPTGIGVSFSYLFRSKK